MARLRLATTLGVALALGVGLLVSGTASAVAPAGLLGYWAMDNADRPHDGSGAEACCSTADNMWSRWDYHHQGDGALNVGNGVNGHFAWPHMTNPAGHTGFGGSGGKFGGALDFSMPDGGTAATTNVAVLNNANDPSASGGNTVAGQLMYPDSGTHEFWYKENAAYDLSTGPRRVLIGGRSAGGFGGAKNWTVLDINGDENNLGNGRLTIKNTDTTDHTISFPTSAMTDGWNHFAYTWQAGGNLQLYVNGASQGTAPVGGYNATTGAGGLDMFNADVNGVVEHHYSGIYGPCAPSCGSSYGYLDEMAYWRTAIYSGETIQLRDAPLNVVPEPASLLLVAAGGLAALARRRR